LLTATGVGVGIIVEALSEGFFVLAAGVSACLVEEEYVCLYVGPLFKRSGAI
jgi:hypothetical protein